jgi:hypothetical protein
MLAVARKHQLMVEVLNALLNLPSFLLALPSSLPGAGQHCKLRRAALARWSGITLVVEVVGAEPAPEVGNRLAAWSKLLPLKLRLGLEVLWHIRPAVIGLHGSPPLAIPLFFHDIGKDVYQVPFASCPFTYLPRTAFKHIEYQREPLKHS